MEPIVFLQNNTKSFVEHCKAYDLIDSAIAVVDQDLHVLYQNKAFNTLATPRTRQLALTHAENLIFSHPEVTNTIDTLYFNKKACTVVLNIPFNATMSLPITLQFRPVIGTEQQILCVLVSVEDESISKTIMKKMQVSEKLQTLSNQIQKLSNSNIENKMLIKSLLTKTPFGLMIIDENQQVIQLNEAASKLFNTVIQQATGRHCTYFFNCHQLYDYCPVLKNNEDITQQEVSSCNIKPADKILLKSSAKITFDNRPAILEAFIDISDKVQYERDLLDAIITAEKANMAKTEFLTNISHELRTPLHAILGFSRLGASKADQSREKVEGYFNKIQMSGTTLLNLLNNLLDLSKLEAGKMPLKFSLISLNEVATQVSQEFQALNQEKNIQIKTEFDKELPETSIDVEKIKQVLRNLLGNAVKFSPNNSQITMRTCVNKMHVEFSLEDEGPGIPDDELETIFNKFIQSSKTKDGAGGTGLGLSICREIIQLHKGEIKALSVSTGGKFIFRLPL